MAIFHDEDFVEDTKEQATIVMNDTFNITATTVSPLLQLDENGEQRKRYTYIDNHSYKEPFFSANGFRGLLRRIMTKDMIKHIKNKEPNFKISSENFYLYSSGASTSKHSLEGVTWDNLSLIREKAPILSLFGAGLSSISGKLAVCDLIPVQENKKIDRPLYQSQVYFRSDDTSSKSFMSELVDVEDIDMWKHKHIKEVMISKKQKETGDIAKETTSHISQVYRVEGILPNITLTTSISPAYGTILTDVELGLILKALFEVSKMQIGASKRLGYGVLDWSVELNSQTMFNTICDKEYIFNRHTIVSSNCQRLIDIYEKWAKENYSSYIGIKDLIK